MKNEFTRTCLLHLLLGQEGRQRLILGPATFGSLV
jgi:hypothetical protein